MRSSTIVLLAVGVPVLISTLTGVGIHAYLAASAPPVPRTVADAVMQGASVRMIELIRAGADPTLPVEMPLEGIAGDRPVQVTPLMLAVANRDVNFVRLLTSMNIPWSREQLDDAYCLAAVLTHVTLEPFLGAPSVDRARCPERMDRLDAPTMNAP
jgi:hypothetical protein